jgi:hypothetical protein
MHQVMISSADFNGSDLGLRQKYGPLFDKYGVDLVVCGHEHHYERSLAVRGVVSGSETLTPNPVSPATDVIDTSLGTVHMVLGGGGVSGTSNQFFYTDGTAKVITAVSSTPSSNGHRTPTYVKRAGDLDGRTRRRAPVRLRGVHSGPGAAPRRHDAALGHLLQRERAARRPVGVRDVHPAASPLGRLTESSSNEMPRRSSPSSAGLRHVITAPRSPSRPRRARGRATRRQRS